MSTPADDAEAAGNRRALLAARLRDRVSAASAGPASIGQQSLWFLHQLAPASAALNIAFTARILSAADPHAIRLAFQQLVDRHPALRTVFPAEAGVPVRRVLTHLSLPFEQIDVSGRSEADVFAAIAAEIDRPFDLAAGPLVRVALFTSSGGPAYLAASFHHIVMDGWSLWLCLTELAAHSGTADTRAVVPDPRDDFGAYVRRQAEMIEGPDGARHLAYWRARISDAMPPLTLSTDHRRPAVAAFRGSSVRFRLGREAANGVRELARQSRSTPHMVMVALYQTLLHRYSGQGELTIGYLASGRSMGAFDHVVGYLANPLPLTSGISADTPFSDLLRRTRDNVLEALEHEEYPFPLIVQHLAPQRDMSRSPIFQALFVFEKPQVLGDRGAPAFAVGEPGVRMTLGTLELESLPFAAQREGQFELTLVMAEWDGDVVCTLDYRTDLFERATIERLAGHLGTLAASAAADPLQRVSALPMLTAVEVAAQDALNATAVDVPPITFHELVAQHAARQPEAPAVVFEGQSLSYRELDRRANALARGLAQHGVEVGTLVGLCAERSIDLIVAVLGILKAGGAFVPLDPRYPEDRLAYMLADAEVPVLVTARALADRWPSFSGRVIHLESVTDRPDAGGSEVVRVQPHDLAYVIYTSGSTGRPKGVLLEHKGLVNVAVEQQRMFGVAPGWRVLQFSSMSFDASVFDIAMGLGSGATLYMARQEELLPGPPLVEMVRSNEISIVTLPPSALASMPVTDLPALRVITVAGEACGAELVSRWAAGRAFFNLYGPTEATIWATAVRCTTGEVAPTIGLAIANTQTYVLDDQLQRVPDGVPGELYLGGRGLARGYHRQPELTARAFLDNPYASHERMYRTGDRVRRRADGELEFLGRIDTQVKVRGFRIELGEIEAVLATHTEVEQAVAVVRGDPSLGQIAAYVTPRRGRAPSGRELRAFLRARLPEFMVPSFVVVLEAFPLSPAGKVDRNRLPAPQADTNGNGAVEPSRPHEAELQAIWAGVLGVERVRVDDNFFDCGGTSLLIARLHARLEQLAPGRFSIVDLFSLPTIRAQAARLRGEDGTETASRVDALLAGRDRLRALASRRGAGPAAG